MKNKKVSCKGNISTVVAVIIGVLLLCSIFYHYFFIDTDLWETTEVTSVD